MLYSAANKETNTISLHLKVSTDFSESLTVRKYRSFSQPQIIEHSCVYLIVHFTFFFPNSNGRITTPMPFH